MTKIVTVEVVDNFDKSIPASETVTFVVEGIAYTLDLCDANAQRYREALHPFVEVADEVGPATVTVNGEVLIRSTPQTRPAPYANYLARPVQTHPSTVLTDGLVEITSNGNGHQVQLDLGEEADSPETQPPPERKATNPAASTHTKKPPAKLAREDPKPKPATFTVPEDGYPPNKKWLRFKTQPATSDVAREQGRLWRNKMREWARNHGHPELKSNGNIPRDLPDKYWAHVEEVRNANQILTESV